METVPEQQNRRNPIAEPDKKAIVVADLVAGVAATDRNGLTLSEKTYTEQHGHPKTTSPPNSTQEYEGDCDEPNLDDTGEQEESEGVANRTRTGDIQNHNLAL